MAPDDTSTDRRISRCEERIDDLDARVSEVGREVSAMAANGRNFDHLLTEVRTEQSACRTDLASFRGMWEGKAAEWDVMAKAVNRIEARAEGTRSSRATLVAVLGLVVAGLSMIGAWVARPAAVEDVAKNAAIEAVHSTRK